MTGSFASTFPVTPRNFFAAARIIAAIMKM